MSVQDALRFIERVTSDLRLQSRVREVEPCDDLDAVARIGAASGLEFTADDLREAFLTDWRMRRRFYGAISAPVDAGPPAP